MSIVDQPEDMDVERSRRTKMRRRLFFAGLMGLGVFGLALLLSRMVLS